MKTAICIASGPSLTQADVDYCRGKGKVYAVKECRHLAPWADILYAADTDWWERFDGCADFAGERWTCSEEAAKKYGINHIKINSQLVWSDTPGLIASGGNSGFQVINMAALDGAERIILLGFDYGYDPAQTDKHWWEKEHPRESRYSNYAEWNKKLAKAAEQMKVPVFNASVQSAITCFERVNLREII